MKPHPASVHCRCADCLEAFSRIGGEKLPDPPCSRPIGFDSPTPHAAIEQVIEWLGIGYESTITRKSDGKKITIRVTSEND